MSISNPFSIMTRWQASWLHLLYAERLSAAMVHEPQGLDGLTYSRRCDSSTACCIRAISSSVSIGK